MNIKSYTNIGSEFLKSEFSDNTAKLSLKTISLDLHFLSCGGDEGGREKRNAGSQTQPSDLDRFCLVRQWETVALQNQSHLSSTQLKSTMSNINHLEFLYRHI